MEDKERYKAGERAIAPIVATVIPALIVTVLMVVTAISSKPHEKHEWDIARPVEDDQITPIDDGPRPDPPPNDIQPPDATGGACLSIFGHRRFREAIAWRANARTAMLLQTPAC